jgi:hypothetical protein
MKYLRILTIVIGLALLPSTPFLLSGCKTTTTGTTPGTSAPNEAYVVNAEKTLRISKDTFDLFLKIEYDNRELVKQRFPQIHTFAEYLRKNAPTWLVTANNLKNDYKHSNVGLNALLNALSVLTTNTNRAQTYINEIRNP